jgi:branched-chain amino acid transport system permease protein
MFNAEFILQTVISALLMGSIYALVAVGLCLIWGLMEIVNFAHGEMLMLGMFSAFWMYTLYHIDPIISLPLCMAILFLIGVATYFIVIKKILQAPFLAQILATFGLGIFLRYLAQFMWSPDFRMIQNPALAGRLRFGEIFIGISVISFVLLYLFITKTETGYALLATSEDRDAACLMGINSDKMYALGWGIGAACLGIAGALISNFYYVFPEVGFPFALVAYVAVALGGFGSIPGSFIAAIIIGLVEGVGGLIAPAFKYTFVFIIYLLVVFIRPQGLWGRY